MQPHADCSHLPASPPCHPALQFVAVYDGHSSHHGSEHASRRLHEFIAAQEAVRQCQVMAGAQQGPGCEHPGEGMALGIQARLAWVV